VILVDTDVLSALAKTQSLHLLFRLFGEGNVQTTAAVVAELRYSLALGREYARDVFSHIDSGRIPVIYLTSDEVFVRDQLPTSLNIGERETMAAAECRNAMVLSNESRVAHHCKQRGIPCFRLADLLRALWLNAILTKIEVAELIEQLKSADDMKFKQATLDKILAD
jgi:predicted nucleic acid-binding protein